MKREVPFFLKGQINIKEFSAGMHQLDIQQLGPNQFYYVYDGNYLKNDSKTFNLWGPLKWTYIDLKNWLFN